MTDQSETAQKISPQEVAQKMKIDYSRGVKDRTLKNLESVDDLFSRLDRPDFDLNMLVREAAELISRQFGIASVAIAVWNPNVERYRFRATTGFREEGVRAYEALSFTKEQVFDEARYPSHEISRQTRLYLSEQHPYIHGEENSFARPTLLGMRRTSLTESLEGDYLCTFFYGPGREILGWIEISGTRMRRLPDAETIRWVELIARILGVAVRTK